MSNVPPVVRWLKKYGGSCRDWQEICRFESEPKRQVCAEALVANKTEPEKPWSLLASNDQVGLLLDTKKSVLGRCYDRDAFTMPDGGGILRSDYIGKEPRRKDKDGIQFVKSWREVGDLQVKQLNAKGSFKRTFECTVWSPKYKAVVYVSDVSKESADLVGKLMNLPVVKLESIPFNSKERDQWNPS